MFVAEFIGAPKMNTFAAQLKYIDGNPYVNAFGHDLPVLGEKGQLLKDKSVPAGDIILGVRPEHISLVKDSKNAIECKILVKEMMGSELHLHVSAPDGSKLIVIVQTMDLTTEERHALTAGSSLYVTFEGKVMHFFNPETELNLIY